jgi:hypothetical protein
MVLLPTKFENWGRTTGAHYGTIATAGHRDMDFNTCPLRTGSYGTEIMKRKHFDRKPREKPTDHMPSICFYIRCWITKHAVQIFRQRKGKARASVATRDLSGSDHSDIEQPRISPHLNGVIPPDPRLAALNAPSMLPPTNPSRIWSTSARARSDDEAIPKGLTAAFTDDTEQAQGTQCSGAIRVRKIAKGDKGDSFKRRPATRATAGYILCPHTSSGLSDTSYGVRT